jgi:hypothetical protein
MTEWCCDNHNDGFDVNSFFLAPILPNTPIPALVQPPQAKQKTYQPNALHNGLALQLWNWQKVAHSDDPAYQSFPISLLLSDTGIDILTKAKRTAFTDKSVMVTLLEESAKWHNFAAEVFHVIQRYDLELEAEK